MPIRANVTFEERYGAVPMQRVCEATPGCGRMRTRAPHAPRWPARGRPVSPSQGPKSMRSPLFVLASRGSFERFSWQQRPC
jgi:hypothetical protein